MTIGSYHHMLSNLDGHTSVIFLHYEFFVQLIQRLAAPENYNVWNTFTNYEFKQITLVSDASYVKLLGNIRTALKLQSCWFDETFQWHTDSHWTLSWSRQPPLTKVSKLFIDNNTMNITAVVGIILAVVIFRRLFYIGGLLVNGNFYIFVHPIADGKIKKYISIVVIDFPSTAYICLKI